MNEEQNIPKFDGLSESDLESSAAIPENAGRPPTYRFYISFDWEIRKGKKSGSEAVFLDLSVPEITTEQQIIQLTEWLKTKHGYDHVILRTPFLQLDA